jgi:hypothetical protein
LLLYHLLQRYADGHCGIAAHDYKGTPLSTQKLFQESFLCFLIDCRLLSLREVIFLIWHTMLMYVGVSNSLHTILVLIEEETILCLLLNGHQQHDQEHILGSSFLFPQNFTHDFGEQEGWRISTSLGSAFPTISTSC